MLRIVDTVLELIREVRPLAEAVGRHDRELARQLRESLDSVAANIAEGSGQIGRRRPSHYSIALGSAREALVHLRVAEAWGYIPPVAHDTRGRSGRGDGLLGSRDGQLGSQITVGLAARSRTPRHDPRRRAP